MIYVFTALYCEAHIFIKRYGLVKNPENTWFQEFYNESAGIRLTITGVGEINASAAVSSVCSLYRPDREDLLFNVGTCAHAEKEEGIFLCHKIVEQATGRSFYPDMLYRHEFREGTVVTCMRPWDGRAYESGLGVATNAALGAAYETAFGTVSEAVSGAAPETALGAGKAAHPQEERIFDMEAAAVYQAGSRFFGPHQMMFLKAVSDRGTAETISEKQIRERMERYQEKIFCYVERIQQTADQRRRREMHAERQPKKEEALIEAFCQDMRCSKAMRDMVEQYIRYLILAGRDYTGIVREMYEEGYLPCKDKREGKRCLEEFKRRLL